MISRSTTPKRAHTFYKSLRKHMDKLDQDKPLLDPLSQRLDTIAKLAHMAARSPHPHTRAQAMLKIRTLVQGG